MKTQWKVIGRRMRVARLALGITEREAAAGFGVALCTYRKYEAGRRQRSMTAASNFKGRYGVSLDWLFNGEGHNIQPHLWKGKVAILPVVGPLRRRPVDPRVLAILSE